MGLGHQDLHRASTDMNAGGTLAAAIERQPMVAVLKQGGNSERGTTISALPTYHPIILN